MLPVKLTHGVFEGLSVAITEIAGQRALALPVDPLRRGIVPPAVGAGYLAHDTGDRPCPDRRFGEKRLRAARNIRASRRAEREP